MALCRFTFKKKVCPCLVTVQVQTSETVKILISIFILKLFVLSALITSIFSRAIISVLSLIEQLYLVLE